MIFSGIFSVHYTDAVALLAAHSRDLELKNGFGLTPLQEASENGFTILSERIKDRITFFREFYGKLKHYDSDLSQILHYFTYNSFGAVSRQVDETWTSYIARSTTERLERWLALEDKILPPEILEPVTPPPIILTQDEWETNKEFELRHLDKLQERQKIISKLQEEFKIKAEIRNQKIIALKQIQQLRLTRLSDYRSAFAQFTMEELFMHVEFEDVSLGKNTGDLFFNNIGFGLDTVGSFVIKNADKILRQGAFQNPKSLEIGIKPFTDVSGGFGIREITVLYNGESYTALPTGETPIAQGPLTALIDNTANYIIPQEQVPAFIDPNVGGVLTYKDGRKVLTGFDENLYNRILQLPETTSDNQKWAFVIGAENYLNTDDIIYARRSAELFALTAQKVLGVPESHLVTLYDEEATGYNIKWTLKELLDKLISEGDTLYFYYNGHGVPNPSQGKSPYMLPTDMKLDYISAEPFFDLRNLYRLFQESKAGEVIVFMDSCFTGNTDDRSIFHGKAAPRLAPSKINITSSGNLAILTAGTDTQFSSAWPEKGHRLFTFHLIEALVSGANRVDALYNETKELVSRTSRNIGGALSYQDPTLQGNGEIEW